MSHDFNELDPFSGNLGYDFRVISGSSCRDSDVKAEFVWGSSVKQIALAHFPRADPWYSGLAVIRFGSLGVVLFAHLYTQYSKCYKRGWQTA